MPAQATTAYPGYFSAVVQSRAKLYASEFLPTLFDMQNQQRKPNALINEVSPYLQQHAYNPVQWQAWNDESLQRAVDEDKLILLSIGYSTCHWCHVMERESFEDEAVAEIMNDNFINIKVDREERPDVDHIYMDALQAMTGSGGWPLNIFLTPDKKPVYGGTYFPPQRMYNRASWTEVLHSLHDAWTNNRKELIEQGEQLINYLKETNNTGGTNGNVVYDDTTVQTLANIMMQQADKRFGGFGAAPKFPQPSMLNFLLEAYYFSGDESYADHLKITAWAMKNHGLYDHLGGGFYRYATDAEWRVPHFEKMLYDNAQLLSFYASMYKMFKDESYKTLCEETIAFLDREMKAEAGAYYTAIDADSEGVEGKFYTWDYADLKELAGEDLTLLNKYFDVKEEGNWEHTNILWLKEGISFTDAEIEKIQGLKNKLFEIRKKRERPITDTKILCSLNAMLVSAFCKCYEAFGKEEYRDKAVDVANYIEWHFVKDNGTLLHQENKEQQAFLDSYAMYCKALIDLQQITGTQHYVKLAAKLLQTTINKFSDEDNTAFYFSPEGQKDIPVRKKDLYDGAQPSANSVLCYCMLYLSSVFENKQWQQRAERMLQEVSGLAMKYPGSFSNWASSLSILSKGGFKEIVLAGEGATEKLKAINKHFFYGWIIQSSEKEEDLPLLKGRFLKGNLLYYVCYFGKCEAPTRDEKFVLEHILLKK